MRGADETIVAIATARGRGGIGVVRLSGAGAREIAEPLCRLKAPMAAGRARFGELVDAETGAVLDEAVVTYFAGPRSYTGEDVVEIAVHGAHVLLEYLARTCVARGARLAEPGEFTERAFLSGRLDLTQAEAVHDLIAASTLNQARVAAAQLGGSVARAVGPAKARLLALIAELEAGVDFAEDDLELMSAAAVAEEIAAVRGPLAELLATYGYGRVVREGFTLAIVGRPNVGKSSLFNRLLERERAIVTAEPGTTRDPVGERMALDGIPVEMVDTAGLRGDPVGEAEREGIARSRTAMAEADFVLHVLDGSAYGGELTGEDAATAETVAGRPYLLVLNKVDLVGTRRAATPGTVWTSTKTGEGLEELKRAIVAGLVGQPAGDAAMITNLRHKEALEEAVGALEDAARAAADGLPQEMVLMDLYRALRALDTLTGGTAGDEILRLIFGKFCIGK